MTTPRPHRSLRTGAFALLSAAAFTGGCAFHWNEARFHETRTLAAPHFETMGLDVETANGRINVQRAQSNTIEITAEIRAHTQERLDNTFIVANQMDEDLIVRVEWADGLRLNNEGCSFTIAMPSTERINLTSRNGRLTVESLSGEATLRTSNGRITVIDHVGDVEAHTSNGRIVLESIDGGVRADTSNGAIRVIGVSGPVTADTSNGSVRVELTDDNPGPVNIDTSNGSIALVVGETFAGSLVADTSSGSIRCDLPGVEAHKLGKRNWRYTFSGDGPESLLDTSNGSITVQHADRVASSSNE